jgi:hypothetical protein
LDVASHGSTWLHMAPPIPAFLRLPHVAAHILRQIQRVFCMTQGFFFGMRLLVTGSRSLLLMRDL